MTGLIPREFIDNLLERVDLIELINDYVPLKKKGGSYLACCPFHHEKTPSFNVNPKKQFYHCFGCGVSGNAISFMMEHQHQGFPEAVESLSAKVGMIVPRDPKTQARMQVTKSYLQLLKEVNHYYRLQLRQHPKAQSARQYLQQRGLDGNTANKYQLGFAPPGWDNVLSQFRSHQDSLLATGMLIKNDNGRVYDRYRDRITFPIHDRRGNVIGFGGRVIHPGDEPKYLNSPETVLFHKSHELYGHYQLLQENSQPDYILLVEGYMDVIALAQHQVNQCVGTLGTATSKEHIQYLSQTCKHIIFCFDGDRAGKQAAWRALENSLSQLNDEIKLSFIFLPQGDDPDSLIRRQGKETFLKLIKNATPLNQFFFDTLQAQNDTSEMSGCTNMVSQASPLLKQIAPGAYRQLMLEQLARLTRMDSARLEPLIYSQKSPLSAQQKPAVKSKKLSHTKLAIALLLQNPKLVEHVNDKSLPAYIDGRGITILKDLIQQIIEHPQHNTAMLIEHWRGQEIFQFLRQLAGWHHTIPQEGVSAEFIGAIAQIHRQASKQHIDHLLKRASKEGLTQEERQKLQELISATK